MATRLYLPSSGASPLPSLAAAGAWDSLASVFSRGPMAVAKADTALAAFAMRFPSTATQYTVMRQFVSPPLSAGYAFDADDDVSYVVSTSEESSFVDAYTKIIVRIVSEDGATERGTLNDLFHPTEWATSWRTRADGPTDCSEVAAQAGDRIVAEFGAMGSTPSVDYDALLRFGDPSDTADFAATFNNNLTTDLCPWVELSPNLTFSAEGGGTPETPMTTMRGVW